MNNYTGAPMFNKRFFRIAAGVILLGVLAIATIPNLYQRNSVDGVVNARTTTLRSPIAGTLHFIRSTEHGTVFKKGELIGQVVNDRVDQSFLHELLTEKNTLESRLATHAERVKTFERLRGALGDNLAKYQAFSEKQLEAQIHQEEQKTKQEKSENERARLEVESSRVLSQRSTIPKRELERHEANYQESCLRLIQSEGRVKELENSLASVKSGAFLGDGHNDSPYSKQRMDQLLVEISNSRIAMDEARDRLKGIDQQIEVEKARIQKAQHFEVVAPYDTLAWRIPASEGSSLVIDSEIITLLDCSSVFLDISVSETQFSDIKPKDQIPFRLIGETGYHTGTVFALRGSGTVTGDKNLAAELKKDPKKEFRVWLKFRHSDLDLTAGNFFQVGRRVECKIMRKWAPRQTLLRFWDVF